MIMDSVTIQALAAMAPDTAILRQQEEGEEFAVRLERRGEMLEAAMTRSLLAAGRAGFANRVRHPGRLFSVGAAS